MDDLQFIPSLLDTLEDYKSLVSNIKNHRLPAAVTGLATIHKIHFTSALSRTLGRKILFIASDEACLTKTPGVFVAGDCRTKGVRQVATAVGDGATAALAACRYLNSLTF